MPDFIWKGIKNTQYLNGTITALTRDEAAFKLKEDGIIITHLDKKGWETEKKEASTPSADISDAAVPTVIDRRT